MLCPLACVTDTATFSDDTVLNVVDEQLTFTGTVNKTRVRERTGEPIVTVVPKGDVAALAVVVETANSATRSAASVPTREMRMTTPFAMRASSCPFSRPGARST